MIQACSAPPAPAGASTSLRLWQVAEQHKAKLRETCHSNEPAHRAAVVAACADVLGTGLSPAAACWAWQSLLDMLCLCWDGPQCTPPACAVAVPARDAVTVQALQAAIPNIRRAAAREAVPGCGLAQEYTVHGTGPYGSTVVTRRAMALVLLLQSQPHASSQLCQVSQRAWQTWASDCAARQHLAVHRCAQLCCDHDGVLCWAVLAACKWARAAPSLRAWQCLASLLEASAWDVSVFIEACTAGDALAVKAVHALAGAALRFASASSSDAAGLADSDGQVLQPLAFAALLGSMCQRAAKLLTLHGAVCYPRVVRKLRAAGDALQRMD